MHPVILKFASKHRHRFGGSVLEVGSYNVNGTVRDALPVTLGVDMAAGPGVDAVCDVADLLTTYGAGSFDCVVSCDALEHMEHWKPALENIWGVLKPSGILLLTMANKSKGFHGYPSDYWRWSLPDFCRLFGDNPVIDSFEGGPSMGVVVRKDHKLDLSVQPVKVKK